jgi:DNA replication protein DnaC
VTAPCTASGADPARRLEELCVEFKLPTLKSELAQRLRDAGLGEALDTVVEAFELEASDRQQRRVDRLRRASQLPPGKTFETLDLERLPRKLQVQLRDLARGDFVARCANVLAFGLPGVGKTHAMIALGHALVECGIAVYFTPAFKLVQHLLAAKRDLELPRVLRKLDRFDVVIVDDLGYVQQSADDAEVLFTLMAERYERRSLVVTSNLVFSHWDRIFGNPMATAAAIDRVVHHSVILEFDVPSKRAEDARNAKAPTTAATEVPA